MQPAVAEVVQNSTLPASTASARARFGAMTSIAWCGPPGLGSPKSSVYDVVPSTGKTIVVGGFLEPAAAVPATRVTRRARAGTGGAAAVVPEPCQGGRR